MLFQNVGIGLTCGGICWFVKAAREKFRGQVDAIWDRLANHWFEVLVNPIAPSLKVGAGSYKKTFFSTDGFNSQVPRFVEEMVVERYCCSVG